MKSDPVTLGELQSPVDPSVILSSKTVRDITQGEIGKEVARRYLKELEVLGHSGKAGFLSFLQSELQAGPTPQPETQVTNDQDFNAATDDAEQRGPVKPTGAISPGAEPSTGPVHIDESIFPSHVQKVTVEHIICNEPTHMPHRKIRTFSDRLPRPNGEMDYETWRTQVDFT